MKQLVNLRSHAIWAKRVSLSALILAGILWFDATWAAQTIGDVADNVTKTFSNLAKLIMAGAYIVGAGFFVASLLKFKQHKDNPTQIPVGTPIALLFIGAALVFMPTLIGIAGETVFSSGKEAGTVEGVDDFHSK